MAGLETQTAALSIVVEAAAGLVLLEEMLHLALAGQEEQEPLTLSLAPL